MHQTFPFLGLLIPIVAILMPVIIVGIVFWYKAREKELAYHQEMRLREIEHQRRMKEMEVEQVKLELEKARLETKS